MSQTGDKTTSPGGFGPNEWLVEELYQQYLADKDSVDKAWWDFFQDYRPDGPPAATNSGNGATAPPAPATTTPRPVSTPAPEPATPRGDGAPAPEPVAQKPAAAPVSPSTSSPGRSPESSPAPAATKAAAPTSMGSGDVSTLKGPAARVVTNMQASLAVPTATSVRAVPAKLLIDNRTVINNALRRGRGGKVSFTHLIGFAVVKALAAMPEMNYGFVEQEGRSEERRVGKECCLVCRSRWSPYH